MSQTIHTPTITSVVDNSVNSSTITIGPLHTGYGMTLANSLRRVLLGSIGGAAVTEFRIAGINHEFTAIDGVKEDVVDIMQALKGIRFKVFSDKAETLTLHKKGAGVVTAADIKTNADVEIVNPSHEICTLTNANSEIQIDLIINKGRGYRHVDENTKKTSSDFISIDSIFSPVLRVRYNVENTRVGQMTDLDKILLTIETDGSITPIDAFEEANAILASQYQALAGKTKVTTESMTAPKTSVAASDSKVMDKDESGSALNTPIEDMGFSARTTNALTNNDIHTLQDLFSLNSNELKELKGFGSKALDEVKDKLAELEL